jgi:uncharacterized membrane protein YkvA (DUF1232 family)
MDSLKITFELSSSDLKHFRNLLKDSMDAAKDAGEKEVLDAAEGMLEGIEKAKPPEFIGERMVSLRTLIEMMRDEEFALAKEFRGRVTAALAYFANPNDLIPDSVPGLGFLDDAIMVEIVRRELAPEIEAYESFCKAREARRNDKKKHDPDSDAAFIEDQRRKLFERIRERRRSANARSRRRSSYRFF